MEREGKTELEVNSVAAGGRTPLAVTWSMIEIMKKNEYMNNE